MLPLVLLILLSSLTSAFKVQFPIASGSNMSVSYVVDIAALILRGPHATMIVGAASGWSQTTLNVADAEPALPHAVQHGDPGADRAGRRTGVPPARRHADAEPAALIMPLAGMALTYFFVNTVPIALAIALTTNQSAWRIWKTDFVSSAPSYLLGAVAAAVVIKVTRELGLLADAAADGGAALPDLQDVSRRATRARRGRARFSKRRTTRSSRWISS